jgi:hypothetical protein
MLRTLKAAGLAVTAMVLLGATNPRQPGFVGTANADLNFGGLYDVIDLLMLDFSPQTIVADDATPDVSGGSYFVTSANTGATAITDLDTPRVGQFVMLCGGSNTNSTTIADSGNFALNGALTLSLDVCVILFAQADNDYVEFTRNNAGGWVGTATSDLDMAAYNITGLGAIDTNAGQVTITEAVAAAGLNGVCIGDIVQCDGDRSVNIGFAIDDNNFDETVSIGDASTVTGAAGISIGDAATTVTGIAIGDDASSTSGVAVGDGAVSSGANSHNTAVGSSTSATATAACVAIGNGAGCSATDCVSLGEGSTCTQTQAISIGSDSTTGQPGCIAIGDNSTTSTFTKCVAFGIGATCAANNDFQLGTSTDVLNLKSYGLVSIGRNATITVDGATTFVVASGYATLACTGAETLITATAGSLGSVLVLASTDTECTLQDDDTPEVNEFNLLGTGDDTGAANKHLTFIHDGSAWQQTAESDN